MKKDNRKAGKVQTLSALLGSHTMTYQLVVPLARQLIRSHIIAIISIQNKG